MTTVERASARDEVELVGVLDEFRTALREELDAARRASASGAIQLVNGRRIAQVGGAYQYLFLVESALNAPDDSPGDLYVPGAKPVETTIISVEGLAVTLSVPVDLGAFVPRAALQSDLTHLLRKLIERIEALGDKKNPAGDRLLGDAAPSGEPAEIEPSALNVEQMAAVASSIGRDTTFIWGPPGTGKTRTIGQIGVELVRRGRSLLLVSHTNAAVDQAILKIADELGEELVDGSVLRLGVTKEEVLLKRPRLLAETHIDERGAALAVERDELTGERTDKVAHLLQVRRLIAIWEWLPEAERDINESHAALGRLNELEERLREVEARVSVLEQDAKAIRPRAETARETLRGERRLGEIRVEVEQRLAELEAELAHERPLVAAAAEDVATLDSAREEAEALLAETVDVSGLVRRWRRLPKPEEQEQVIESLRSQYAFSSAAHRTYAVAIEALESEAEECATLSRSLPPPVKQQTPVERDGKRDQIEALRAERGELGDPRGAFVATYEQDPERAIEEAAVLEGLLARARADAASARAQAASARGDLESELLGRLTALREWGLSSVRRGGWGLSTVRRGGAEDALEEIERAHVAAKEIVIGTNAATLLIESQRLNNRIRQIDGRLDEIQDELQRVEELVIGEALVVATTLTRAYKRESVQKRRFDTVVLDEASMAPIPALWVAASLADANVVLVGDFRQLPPIKHSDHELAEKWLGRDVFDVSRVKQAFEAGEAPAHFIQLQEQFRMHPAISAIPNRFLYDGTLRNGAGVEDDGMLDGWYQREWGYDSPVLLVDTGSLNAWVTSVNNAGRTSRLNFLSATCCVDIAEMLLLEERSEITSGHPRILIGAPYRPQAKLINLLIREHKLDPEVRAGTAHTFQGSEAPVMIFDLVNDEPHWKVAMFMSDLSEDFKRLLNVALTRAQRRLIIVGDFDYISKLGKKAFIRELIDFLRERYPVAEAAQLIPAGLSARAARMQIQAKGGDEVEGERLVVTQDSFDHYLLPDLESAEQRLVIFSPFLTYERVALLEPQLRAAAERGARVVVVTKGHAERGRQLDGYRHIERTLTSWGVTVVHKARMHEKLVFVDEDLLWHGSLNPLSFSNTQEIMERRRSKAVVEDYQRTLRLQELLGAYEQREAGAGACPFCGGEIVATEGRDDPYYWRCVEDRCFSRSIDDPMPRDGMVVCTSGGCGKSVHFGDWGGVPHWRCDENPRHRTRIGRSHLRLPKMRALVPASELKKLDKQFGLDGGKLEPKVNGQLALS
jgi:hypothetical protein